MGTGTGPIWRKLIRLVAQFEQIHVEPSDIKLMAVIRCYISDPDRYIIEVSQSTDQVYG